MLCARAVLGKPMLGRAVAIDQASPPLSNSRLSYLILIPPGKRSENGVCPCHFRSPGSPMVMLRMGENRLAMPSASFRGPKEIRRSPEMRAAPRQRVAGSRFQRER
jgi:hypothetical protein